MNDNELREDLIQPFHLEASSLRGRLVRMGSTLDTILQQHAYPLPVATLLAEAMVLAAALSASLKYDGVFTLQAKGDGAIRLLVADVTSSGGVRAYAQFDADKLNGIEGIGLLGKGYLAFTVDQKLKEERYQGIVELRGNTLAEAVQYYFRQSEQLDTALTVAVRRADDGYWHGGCLMLQAVARQGGLMVVGDTSAVEDWQRSMILMATCTDAELTDSGLTPDTLLYRLFHEEGVRAFDPRLLRHQCRCSADRVQTMLRSLPREEVEQLAVDGVVAVTCEFCNKSYGFNPEQRDHLYASAAVEETT
ncbi:MAG: Hsp33 family molecular chaperone HslO [Alphaproteobacteria bacterium]|nr:Hsp33 family molecular chaperone HslO [Alphaproteobacteria bacterium]